MTERVYAVDFGTSNSLLTAATKGGVGSPIPLDVTAADPSILRSLLYFADRDHVFYGQEAISNFIENEMSGRLFRSFKSHLRSKNYLGTMIENRPMPLEQMVGLFLLQMKNRADIYFGEACDRVVLGRPARYSMDPEEDKFAEYRMRKAAEFAGFKEIEFLPEPVAAAYEFRRELKTEQLVLVADFGGGTSDFTVVRLGPNEFLEKNVLSVGGLPVAGDALDSQVMMKKVAPFFGSDMRYRLPMSQNILQMPPSVMQNLTHPSFIVHLKDRDTYDFLEKIRTWAVTESDRQKIERLFVLVDDNQIFSLFEAIDTVKRDLSVQLQTTLSFAYPDIDLELTVAKLEFDEVIAERVKQLMAELDSTLRNAGLKAEQIDLVCCTGGTSKVPLIQMALEKRFGREKMRTRQQFHSVVQGLGDRALEVVRQS
jgi:hypothetical chaperone protein